MSGPDRRSVVGTDAPRPGPPARVSREPPSPAYRIYPGNHAVDKSVMRSIVWVIDRFYFKMMEQCWVESVRVKSSYFKL